MNMALFPGLSAGMLVALILAVAVLLYAHYSQFRQEAEEARRQQRLAELACSTCRLPDNADRHRDLYNIVVINLDDDNVRPLREIEGR